ncbi:MAG: hypothetical protein Q9218_002822 [Villophora microphyllina]
MRSARATRSFQRHVEVPLVFVVSIILLSAYLAIPQQHVVSRPLGEVLPHQPSASTNSIASKVGTPSKHLTLSLNHQHISSNSSLPLALSLHTKRDDTPFYFIAAQCYGEKLLAQIQDAQKGISSNARRFGKADIQNGWSVVERESFIGLGPDWELAFAHITNNENPHHKGARNVILEQDKDFINKKGEPIKQSDYRQATTAPIEDQVLDPAIFSVVYFARPVAAIFAIRIVSPSNVIRSLFPHYQNSEIERLVPPLNRFSDVIWTIWTLGMGRKDPGRLRYLGHEDVINEETEEVMDYVFERKHPGMDPEWPGEEFGMDQDEGLALLGTPNGYGTAWLLIDRAQSLGRRVTEVKVRIWKNDNDYWHMLWDLGEYPDEKKAPLEVIGTGTILPLDNGVMPGGS